MKFLPARRHFGLGDTVAVQIGEAIKSLHKHGFLFGNVRPLDILVGNPVVDFDRSGKAGEACYPARRFQRHGYNNG